MKRIYFSVVFLLGVFVCFAQDAAQTITSANEALKAKDYAKAFELYDNAMNNLGDVQVDAAINFNIGFAACESGNVAGAEKYMAKAIEANVNVPKCYENLADLYNSKKDYAKAITNYEKAIATSTENADVLTFKAGATAYNGEMYDKAIAMFDKCIQAGYKGETAYFYKATILKKQDKDAEYKAALEEGVTKFPGDAKLAPTLAKVYVAEGNGLYKKGVAILTEANAKVTAGTLKTTDPAYNEEVEKSKVEFKAALEILEKAKALDATNANATKLIDACKAVL